MKKLLIGLGLAVMAMAASAQVSVSVNDRIAPGVYGRIVIGDNPRPDVVYIQPRVIVRDRTYIDEPEYIYVPEWQQRRWDRYCYQYRACNRPVYFVQERWVRDRHEHDLEMRHMYREHNRREWRDGQWHERGEWRDEVIRDRDGRPIVRNRDRDGDGVRNNQDNFPNNPNQR